jgi:hypothetical protein
MTKPVKKTGRTTPKKKPEPVEWTAEDILDAKKPHSGELAVCFDNELKAAAEAAATVLARAELRLQAKPGDPDRQAAYDEADTEATATQEAAAEISHVFKFTAIGRVRLREMIKANRPNAAEIREVQDERKRQGKPTTVTPEFSLERFPPKLMAACMTDPPFTEDQAERLWLSENWSDGETDTLFVAIWNVNKILS